MALIGQEKFTLQKIHTTRRNAPGKAAVTLHHAAFSLFSFYFSTLTHQSWLNSYAAWRDESSSIDG
jgi:hypothetical protein